jgi:hypothetical protein
MRRLLLVAAMAAVVLAGCPPSEFTPDPDPNAATRVVDALYYYPTGAQPFAVEVADIDGDGLLDAVTANGDGNSVSVLLGKAGGGFATQTEYLVSAGPVALAVADFNGDGALDMATVNSGLETISVLLANAEGFGEAVDYALPAGSAAVHVVAADLNGDGAMDLLVAAQGADALNLLLGIGDGTFDTTSAPLAVGSGPRFVLVHPLNTDGLPDIITVNRDSNDVSILLSNATGGYDPPVSVLVGVNPRAAVLTNLNGDTFPDLVVSNPGSGELSILLGLEGGAFGAQTRIAVDGAPTRLAAGDFNGDGHGDVAAILFDMAAGVPIDEIAVLLGDGAGGLGAPRVFGGRGRTIDVVAVNIRGSAALDLVTANSFSDDIGILTGRGDGTFATDERFPVGGRPRVIAAADFNKDGAPDLAVLNQGTADISILLGKKDTTFGPETTLTFTGTPRAMDTADFNKDGNTDLVVTDLVGGAVAVYLGRGDGTFIPQRRFLVEGGGSDARSVSTLDMDGDGHVDIVVGNAARDSVSILLGDGTGSFGAATEFDARNFPLAVNAADLNGDGQGDVVFINGIDPDDPGAAQNPRVRPLLGIGEGALEEAATNGPYRVDANPIDLALYDLDGDGDLDGVTAHGSLNFLNVLAAGGGGQFLAGTILRAGNSPNSVALGLLNSDRFPDIVATCDQDSVSVLLGRAGLFFNIFMLYPVGTNPIGGIIIDLNGDRHSEIVVANRDAGTISVLRGRP